MGIEMSDDPGQNRPLAESDECSDPHRSLVVLWLFVSTGVIVPAGHRRLRCCSIRHGQLATVLGHRMNQAVESFRGDLVDRDPGEHRRTSLPVTTKCRAVDQASTALLSTQHPT